MAITLGIVRRGADEVDHRQERLEGVMQQHVLLFQHAEEIVGIDRRREAGLDGGYLDPGAPNLVRTSRSTVQFTGPSTRYRSASCRPNLLQQEFGHALGAVVGDLEPHGVAEVPVQQLALHRGVQVLDLLLVHEQIELRVTRNW